MEEQIIIDVQLNQDNVKRKLVDITGSINQLKASNQQLKKDLKDLEKSGTGTAEQFAELNLQIAANNSEIKTLTVSEKALQSQMNGLNASNNQLGDSFSEQSKLLANLKSQYSALSKEQRNTEGGKAMKAQIDALDKSVKGNDESLGNFQRHVGDYEGAIKNASNSIAGMKEQLKSLTENLNNMDVNSKEFAETKRTIDDLTLAVGQAEGKIDEFGNREPKNRAKKEFEDTLVTVGILSSSVGALSEAFSENEGVQEALVKAQKALVLSQTISNVVKEKGAIIDTIVLAKEKALAVSKVVLTNLTRIFGLTSAQAWAVATLGLSLLITGIVMLISKFDKVINSIKKFVGASDDFSIIENRIKQINSQLENFDTITKAIIDRLKAQGATEQALLNFEKNRFKEQLTMHMERYRSLSKLSRKLTDDEKENLKESTEFIKNKSIVEYGFTTKQIEINRKKNELILKNNADAAKKQNEIDAKAKQDKKTQQDKELQEIRAYEDAAFAVFSEGVEKQKKEIIRQNKRQIEDLEKRLKDEENLTDTAKNAIKERIKAIKEKEIIDIAEIDEQATRDRFDKEQKAIENDFNEKRLQAIDNEKQLAQIELDAKQQRMAELLNMDAETKKALYKNEEDYRAAVIQAETDIYNAKKSVADLSVKAVEQQQQILQAYGAGITDLLNSIAGDDAEMVKFVKIVSAAQAAANLGLAISKAVVEGAGNPLKMAINVGAVLTAMAGVITSIKSIKEPTAPKFATGGIVPGVGTGDTVHAMLTPKEMILNAEQQARLFKIANGTVKSNSGIDYDMLGRSLVVALRSMPSPVLDYREFTTFQNNVIKMKEGAAI